MPESRNVHSELWAAAEKMLGIISCIYICSICIGICICKLYTHLCPSPLTSGIVSMFASCEAPFDHQVNSNGRFHIPAPAQRYVSPSKKKGVALDLVYHMVGIA